MKRMDVKFARSFDRQCSVDTGIVSKECEIPSKLNTTFGLSWY
jgi:hypothetical protein